jgi:integrase
MAENKAYKPAVLDCGSRKKKLNPNYTFRIHWQEETAPGLFEPIRQTFNLNKDYPDVRERQSVGMLMATLINQALADGWRYHTDLIAQAKEKLQEYTSQNIVDSLQEHCRSKASTMGTPRSAGSYKSSINLFCDFLREKKLDHLSLFQLEVRHVQVYQDYLIKKKSIGATINNEISRVGSIYERIRKQYELPHNPFRMIDRMKESESLVFDIITPGELKKISGHLKTVSPELHLIMLHIYYGFLRPASIAMLQRKDYDFKARTITVRPDAHKNRKRSIKQILKPLHDALIAAGVDRLQPETLVFSKDLKPGFTRISPVRFSELWKELIIDGIGVDKKLYALKHTGASDFLDQNPGQENLVWFQRQMGHSSLKESAAYLDKRKMFYLDEKNIRLKDL